MGERVGKFFLGGITATDQVKNLHRRSLYVVVVNCENELWGRF